MGKFIRSLLVILLTSVGMVAAPALAARPTKSECKQSCSGLVSELAGSSTASRRLTKKQRDTAIAAIGSMIQQCSTLCGFGIVMPSTLGGLQDLLEESNSSSSSGKSNTPAPVGTPPKTTPTAPPALTSTVIPSRTATVPPTVTSTVIPSRTPTVPPTLAVTVTPVQTPTPPPSFTLTPVPNLTAFPQPSPVHSPGQRYEEPGQVS